jgi:drug/metabolite transporter (DMT)-like permease
MTATAIILIVISSAMHAGWNLIGKRAHPSAAFFLVANGLGCAVLGVVLIPYGQVVRHITPEVWALLVCTGVCQMTYFVGLAGAYRHGHMSVAYPLARSLPVVAVALMAFALGRGDSLDTATLTGMALVVAGGVLLPMAHFRDLRLKNYWNRSCALALVAAAGTTGYSLFDDAALSRLRAAPALPVSGAEATLVYAFFEGVTSCLFLALFVFPRKEGRKDLREVWRGNKVQMAVAGVAIYLTYSLVLIAFGFVDDVSYAVAFRQLSIPMGALAGVMVLREPAHAPKFVAVAIMFAGLVLVAVG